MALIERLMGVDDAQGLDRISVHVFFGLAQEYALGTITGQQVVDALDLDEDEASEALALLGAILAEPDDHGKRIRAMEFERVLLVAESGVLTWLTPTIVRSRLGIADD